MKLIITVELTTDLNKSDHSKLRGRIRMFHYIKEINLTAQDVYSLVFHKQILEIKLSNLMVVNADCLKANSSSEISRLSDSLRYYKKLKSLGWIPNVEDAKAIRSDGYDYFDPIVF